MSWVSAGRPAFGAASGSSGAGGAALRRFRELFRGVTRSHQSASSQVTDAVGHASPVTEMSDHRAEARGKKPQKGQPTSSKIEKIGMYRATIMPPMIVPRMAIMRGSIKDVSCSVVAVTSSS